MVLLIPLLRVACRAIAQVSCLQEADQVQNAVLAASESA